MWDLLKDMAQRAEKLHCSVYLVGGSVRDLLLGQEPQDLDFAVSSHVWELSHQLAEAWGGSLVVLDKERQTLRVVLPQLLHLDFNGFKGTTLEEDLAARDFTINAMALPLQNSTGAHWRKHLVDPLGGRSDLQQGLLRVPQADTILQDPLRVLRAIRLSAKLHLAILPETTVYLKQGIRRMEGVAGERIWQELAALLSLQVAYSWVELMDRELQFWQAFLPGRLRMEETQQNYYHVENVWRHSLRTFHCLELLILELPVALPQGEQVLSALYSELVEHRSRLVILKLATLIHDVGKPDTAFKQANGRISFHGHPKAGLPYMEALADRLKLSKPERRLLANLVLYHMKPLHLYTSRDLSPLAIYRLFRTLGEDTLDVLILSLADLTATYTAGERLSELQAYRQFIFSLLEKYLNQKDIFQPELYLTGSDLLALGIPEGYQIGAMLDKLAEAQVTGLVTDRESALCWAKAHFKAEEE